MAKIPSDLINKLTFVFSYICIICVTRSNDVLAERSSTFTIDGKTNGFLKDGAPFRYVSGSVHYFRLHPSDWRDRFRKLRYAGCNAVQTYIEWSSHEPEPGKYNFEGQNDIQRFLSIAQEEGLLVILRPGPYIDAERDMGGFPYWLLRENRDMILRTFDQSYLHFVERWYDVLFPILQPFLYKHGGPIIMVQVENEYGSYPECDFKYTSYLRDLTKRLVGNDVVLYTTDGPGVNFLKCGKIPGVYATIDFGPVSDDQVEKFFSAQRLFEPRGPLINSEFYPGWIDHWGVPHSKRKTSDVVATLDKMLSMNASVNIYVFSGGSAFGFKAGSNIGDRFQPCTTSYDFDAPITEAGDPTDKYFAIRDVIKKYLPLPNLPKPSPTPKCSYGKVVLYPRMTLTQLNEGLDGVSNKWPLTFEELSVNNGIVIYSTKITNLVSDPAVLFVNEIHDRGYVLLDGVFQGVVSRELDLYELPLQARVNQTLSIVVESQGRVCYGQQINDFKGLTTNVTLGPYQLENWEMTSPLDENNLRKISTSQDFSPLRLKESGGMVLYSGQFKVPKDPSYPKNTFLKFDGWSKGYVWINNFLLGRYWPVEGPQMTLFVPHGVLKKGPNSMMVLEFENSPCSSSESSCTVSFTDTPQIDGKTPSW